MEVYIWLERCLPNEGRGRIHDLVPGNETVDYHYCNGRAKESDSFLMCVLAELLLAQYYAKVEFEAVGVELHFCTRRVHSITSTLRLRSLLMLNGTYISPIQVKQNASPLAVNSHGL
jgi:hypothetical protein